MSPLTIRISVTLCIILVLTNPTTSLPRTQRNDVSVADTIRYLNELENAYSQVARPRFGKRNLPFKVYNPENHIDEEEDWPEYPFIRR